MVFVRVAIGGRDIYNDALGSAYAEARGAPTPNQRVSIAWDGRDAYGRLVYGVNQVSVTVTYGYLPEYASVLGQGVRAFALTSATGTTVSQYRGGNANVLVPRLILVERKKQFVVRSQNSAFAQLGGWTINAHHALDTVGNTLYLGDGSRRNLDLVSPKIDALYGPFSTILGAAYHPRTGIVSATSDGRLILTSIVIAGGGAAAPADGVPAITAIFPQIADVAAGPYRNYHFLSGNQVWRLDELGNLRRVAGTGAAGSTGDGGPARDATLNAPAGIAVSTDGTVFVSEPTAHRIRRIGPDGVITTFAGTGAAGFSGDGGPAAQAQLREPTALAWSPNGALLVADAGNLRVRRIAATGTITTLAGNGSACSDPQASCGDGGPALSATFGAIRDIDVLPSREVIVADSGVRRIRAIRSNGLVVSIAGSGQTWTVSPQGDKGPALAATLSEPLTLAADPTGRIFVGDRDRIRLIEAPRSHQSATGLSVASEDGAEIYQFDFAGRHLSTVDAVTGDDVFRFSYDAAGRIVSISDTSDNTTVVERSPAGAPSGIVSPFGQRTTLGVNGNGYLSSVARPDGGVFQLEYAGNGLLTRLTDPRNNASVYEYDAAGRLIRDTDAATGGWDIVKTQTASATRVTMTSREGRSSEFTHEKTAAGDRRVVSREPDGTTSTLTVERNRTEMLRADGTRLTVAFGGDPRFGMQAPFPASAVIRLPSGLQRTASSARAVALSNINDPSSVISISETSTLNGRSSTSVYTAASRQLVLTSPTGRTAQTTLDAAGRVINTSVPGINSSRMTYDARGRLATLESGGGSALRQTTVTYVESGPAAGLTDTITDAEGRVTTLAYDAAGRVTTQTLPGNRQVFFGYDANGNLTSITPPGRSPHIFDYSAVNLPATYAPPAAGLPISATVYAYNRDRQLTSVTRPDGQQITFLYGASGKLDSLTTPRGVIGYSYTPSTGQLSGISTSDGETLALAFDGILPTSSSWSGPVSGNVSIGYSSDFDVSTVSVNGSSIAFAYDLDGLLTGAGDLTVTRRSSNGLEASTALDVVTTENGYSTFGELSSYTASRPTASQNDIADQIRAEVAELGTYLNAIWTGCSLTVAQQEYNNLVTAAQGLPNNTQSYDSAFATFRPVYQFSLRPTARFECLLQELVDQADASIAQLEQLRFDLANAGAGGQATIYSAQYVRDRLGRITRKTENVEGVQVVFDYGYDTVGRLQQVLRNGSVIESYTYDVNGNRLTAGSTTATYDGQDRLLTSGSASFTYTANGDLLTKAQSGQTTTYAYDVLGNLLSAQLPDGRTVSYVIDGQNRRVGKRVNGTLTQGFLYQDQLRVAAELDAGGSVVSRFVYGTRPNGPDYMIRGGVAYRIVADHLGSPRLVVNASTGQVVQRIDYDAFGNVTADTNPGFQPFGFAGGLYDRDTELTRFGARDYDPLVGRWTAKDRIGFLGGDPNLYGYVINDPVNLVDPSGEILPIIFAGAAIGAVVNAVATVLVNRGDVTAQQIGAAIVSGAIAGAFGAVAGPLGGTLARAVGQSAAGFGATAATAAISAAGGAAGQAAANGLDPCNASSVGNAALYAGLGGAIASRFFPVKGMYTLAQAAFFAPSTFAGIMRSTFFASAAVSAGIGAGSNFGGPF